MYRIGPSVHEEEEHVPTKPFTAGNFGNRSDFSGRRSARSVPEFRTLQSPPDKRTREWRSNFRNETLVKLSKGIPGGRRPVCGGKAAPRAAYPGGVSARKPGPGADLVDSQRRSANVSRGSLRSIAALGPLVLANDRVKRGDRVPARSEFGDGNLRHYLSLPYGGRVRPGP